MSFTISPLQLVSLTAGDTYVVVAPTQMTTASLNGDGVVDIVVYQTGGAQTVAALKGHGDGHFDDAIAVSKSPIWTLVSFAVGAIDSDTKLDIVVQEYSAGSGFTDVHFGLGNGVFGPPNAFAPISVFPGPVILTDVDHDGDQDIIRVNGHELELMKGDGNGSFGPVQGIYDLATVTGRVLTAADFNGDGRMDLAVAGFGAFVLVLDQDINGNFSSSTTVPIPTGMLAFEIVAADINGDGRSDLVIGEGSVSQGYAVTVAFSKIDGTFDTPIVTAVNGYTGAGIAVADMNGDGYLDVVMTTQSGPGVDILLGHGDGTFTEQDNVGTFGGNSITTGDFNGDGKQDIAVGQHDGNTVSIMLNTTAHITTRTVTAADGSVYVYTYSDGHLIDLVHSGIPNLPYTMQHTVYELDGTRTSSVRTDANGDAVSTFTFDSKSGDKTFVNNDLSYQSVIHTDGTQDFYYTNIQNELWTEDHRHYDMSGMLDQDTRTYNHTAVVYTDDFNAGVETIDRYDRSGVHLLHEVSSVADGTDITLYTNGVATNETIVHADHSKDVYVHDVQGKSYTDDHRHYDASGVLDQQTRTHNDGSDDYTYVRDALTGVETTDRYDSSGVRTSHAVVDAAANTSDTFTYTGGVLVREVQIHGDQTKDILLSNVTGKTFTAEHDSYDFERRAALHRPELSATAATARRLLRRQ